MPWHPPGSISSSPSPNFEKVMSSIENKRAPPIMSEALFAISKLYTKKSTYSCASCDAYL